MSTIFWWDNFDRNIETEAGGGSIHNTPGVVFQEKNESSAIHENEISIVHPNSKRRSITLERETDMPTTSIIPKTNPSLFVNPKEDNQSAADTVEDSQKLLSQWKVSRYICRKNQSYPRFAGWTAKLFQKDPSEATVLTYLPPIPKPITDYGTIVEIFYKSRQLAIETASLQHAIYSYYHGCRSSNESLSRDLEQSSAVARHLDTSW